MEDKKVTAEETKAGLAGGIDAFAEQTATAMNEAKAGSVFADSELAVFEASGRFRQQAFEKALDVVPARQEAFPLGRQGCGTRAASRFGA